MAPGLEQVIKGTGQAWEGLLDVGHTSVSTPHAVVLILWRDAYGRQQPCVSSAPVLPHPLSEAWLLLASALGLWKLPYPLLQNPKLRHTLLGEEA